MLPLGEPGAAAAFKKAAPGRVRSVCRVSNLQNLRSKHAALGATPNVERWLAEVGVGPTCEKA